MHSASQEMFAEPAILIDFLEDVVRRLPLDEVPTLQWIAAIWTGRLSRWNSGEVSEVGQNMAVHVATNYSPEAVRGNASADAIASKTVKVLLGLDAEEIAAYYGAASDCMVPVAGLATRF